jgi:hypothetical protein
MDRDADRSMLRFAGRKDGADPDAALPDRVKAVSPSACTVPISALPVGGTVLPIASHELKHSARKDQPPRKPP